MSEEQPGAATSDRASSNRASSPCRASSRCQTRTSRDVCVTHRSPRVQHEYNRPEQDVARTDARPVSDTEGAAAARSGSQRRRAEGCAEMRLVAPERRRPRVEGC